MKTSLGRNCLFASPWDVQPSTGRTLCDSALKYLHYEELDIAEAISWFGATPKLSKCVVEMPYTVPEGAGYQQRTIASLENVRQVEMYYDEEPACTGLLLTYLDASQESVGQRRVGLSTTKITRIDSPRWICIQEFEIMAFEADGDEWVKRQYVEIQLQKEECKRHTGDEDWHCQPMRGEIQWDFDENHDVVEFLSENPLMVVSSPSP
jgi:hypothetical protein